MTKLEHYRMAFDGKLLRRGFWIYVWRIVVADKTVYYVGRTGDSPSCHAASPFMRAGQHLDLRENAKGNALKRRLAERHVSPDECTFEMVAIGPLFPEQSKVSVHRVYRDKAAALEKAVAGYLKEKGKEVLGTHHSKKQLDDTLFQSVRQTINQCLFQNQQ
jgi:hypothetical protein